MFFIELIRYLAKYFHASRYSSLCRRRRVLAAASGAAASRLGGVAGADALAVFDSPCASAARAMVNRGVCRRILLGGGRGAASLVRCLARGVGRPGYSSHRRGGRAAAIH